MRVTAQEEKQYIERGGVGCPKCNSYDVIGLEYSYEKGKILQLVKCCICDEKWTDIYTLTGIYPGEL